MQTFSVCPRTEAVLGDVCRMLVESASCTGTFASHSFCTITGAYLRFCTNSQIRIQHRKCKECIQMCICKLSRLPSTGASDCGRAPKHLHHHQPSRSSESTMMAVDRNCATDRRRWVRFSRRRDSRHARLSCISLIMFARAEDLCLSCSVMRTKGPGLSEEEAAPWNWPCLSSAYFWVRRNAFGRSAGWGSRIFDPLWQELPNKLLTHTK